MRNISSWMMSAGLALAATSTLALAADPLPQGFSSSGPDQTIADIRKVEWQL